ncbi:MAG: nickel-dependent lactate racemase [Clostridiales Family XIII bacterium]|nr:nickel-dependent lactate racemase [Clostridiales Family XIII bacterium]
MTGGGEAARTFSLQCGARSHTVTVPDGVRFLYAPMNKVPVPVDASAEIRAALDAPVGSPRIEELVRPGQKVCIISDDNTRFTPVNLILRELLPRIEGAGVRHEDILIVMALGSHRYMTEAEMREKVGAEIYENYRVMNSEFADPAQLTEVGLSELGTPIRVFKPAMEADVRIGLGTVMPHGCMGFSGGAKILYPGITAADIVSEFHIIQGLTEEILLGMVEAPTRLAVEAWTKNIGLHFIVNVALDEGQRLYRAAAGDYIAAQRRVVGYAQELCGIPLPEAPDVVLTAAHPIYLDFWQCGKAIYAPAKVIKPGGEILVLAACEEGVGPHPDVLRYISMEDGPEALAARVAAGERGEDMLAMAVGVGNGRIARRNRITYISDGLTAAQMAQAGLGHSHEAALQQTLEETLSRFKDPFLLILPEGAEAIPYL